MRSVLAALIALLFDRFLIAAAVIWVPLGDIGQANPVHYNAACEPREACREKSGISLIVWALLFMRAAGLGPAAQPFHSSTARCWSCSRSSRPTPSTAGNTTYSMAAVFGFVGAGGLGQMLYVALSRPLWCMKRAISLRPAVSGESTSVCVRRRRAGRFKLHQLNRPQQFHCAGLFAAPAAASQREEIPYLSAALCTHSAARGGLRPPAPERLPWLLK